MPGPNRPCRTCRRPVPNGDCPRHPKRGGYRPDRPSVLDRVYGAAWRRLVAAVLILAGHRCSYCDGPASTGDHVVPHTRGGGSTAENVVAACGRCNTSKGNRTLTEWVHSGRAPAPAAILLAARIIDQLPV